MSATSVNDILLVSDSKSESDSATSEINNKFTITDSGDAEWILGCRITRLRSKHVLMLDQEQFIVTILCQFGMEHCNPVKTRTRRDVSHLTCAHKTTPNTRQLHPYRTVPLSENASTYRHAPDQTLHMLFGSWLVLCPTTENVTMLLQNTYFVIFKALVPAVLSMET